MRLNSTPHACLECGAIRMVAPSVAASGRGKYCSQVCANIAKSRLAHETFAQRFWDRVDRSGPCWLWGSHCSSDGYGLTSKPGSDQLIYTHRIAWEMATGQAPESDVLHTCDTPGCVRNDDIGVYIVHGEEYERHGHLFLGTPKVNALDRSAKGRDPLTLHPHSRAVGSRHPHSKLSDAQASQIRERRLAGESPVALGIEFHVDRSVIWGIATGRTWKHLP